MLIDHNRDAERLLTQASAGVLVDSGCIAGRLDDPEVRVVEVDRFVGEQSIANTGHIPGACCLPYQELADGATGLWAAPEAVRRLAKAAGIDPDRRRSELIGTRGSGISAAVALLALERIGVHCDGVYDGSFNESGNDHDRPFAYGRAA